MGKRRLSLWIELLRTTATADFEAKERECDGLIGLHKQNVNTAQAELGALSG
jgi:hypothetical protein